MLITSLNNEHIKELIKLKEKKYRDESNTFLVEGRHLALEAHRENKIVELILEKDELFPLNVNTLYVTSNVMKKLSDLTNPSNVMAVVEKLEEKPIGEKILILDNIQDPGNLGTIIRSSVAFNIDTIVLSNDTVDLYNPKVVRSTMGAIFRVKIIECEDLEKTLKEIQKHKFEIVVTSLQTENSIYDIDYKKKVIVIGNEANGVEEKIQKLADKKVKIPMLGKTESLNASVATGIILYEYVRQKIER